jgi:hypothetical protein
MARPISIGSEKATHQRVEFMNSARRSSERSSP